MNGYYFPEELVKEKQAKLRHEAEQYHLIQEARRGPAPARQSGRTQRRSRLTRILAWFSRPAQRPMEPSPCLEGNS